MTLFSRLFKQLSIDIICTSFQFTLAILSNCSLLTLRSFDPKKGTVVHIVGSGASAIETIKKASKSDLFITCNLSVALLQNWDIVFVEQFSEPHFMKYQDKALKGKKIKHLVVKNNYPFRPRKKIDKLKSYNSKYLELLVEAPFLSGAKNFICDRQWENLNCLCIHQYASTLFTMILFALKYKPEKIVLHGIDFGGDNFYAKDQFAFLNPGTHTHVTDKGKMASKNVRKIFEKLTKGLTSKYNVIFIKGVEF
jgi:hypothetical protein